MYMYDVTNSVHHTHVKLKNLIQLPTVKVGDLEERWVLLLLVRWAGLEELQDMRDPCDPLGKGHQLPGRGGGGRGRRNIINNYHLGVYVLDMYKYTLKNTDLSNVNC